MNAKNIRNWGTSLKLFVASAALIGCQSKANAPVRDKPDTNPSMKITTASFTQQPADSVNIFTSADYEHITVTKEMKKDCDIEKLGFVITNGLTGKKLGGYNTRKQLVPASIVKLMTVFLALEEIERGRWNLNDTLYVGKTPRLVRDKQYKKDHAGIAMLNVNDEDVLTVQQAIWSAFTRSAADGMELLAINISGSEKKFVERMNSRAQSLGMQNTRFKNSSGMPDSEQKMSVEDAVIIQQAVQEYFPEDLSDITVKSMTYHDLYIPEHLHTAGADIGKTGCTDASGLNVVASFPVEGGRINIASFGARSKASRIRQMNKLKEIGKELFQKDRAKNPDVAINHTGALPNLPARKQITDLDDFPETILVRYDINELASQNLETVFSAKQTGFNWTRPARRLKAPELYENGVSEKKKSGQTGYAMNLVH